MKIKIANKQEPLRKNVVYISLASIDYTEDQPDDSPSPFGADGWENMGFSDGPGDANHGSSNRRSN